MIGVVVDYVDMHVVGVFNDYANFVLAWLFNVDYAVMTMSKQTPMANV